ncbi:MAG: transporter [Vicinamibacterales bacterium]
MTQAARIRLALFVCAVLQLSQVPARAQDSLVDTLSFLLTNQGVPTGDFVKDQESAEVTRDTIARLLVAELTTTPLSSSSGGFSYRFNPMLGTVERASESFGPFFTERSLTVGRNRASIGAQAQVARYTRLDAYDLRDGSFVTTANQFRDEAQPFDVEALTLRLTSTTMTLFGTMGVHDRVDIGVAVPLVRLSLEGSRLNTYRGVSFLQASATADATGFGDVAVRGKVNLLDRGGSGVAVIEELRLPTGRSSELLGAGEASLRSVVVASSEVGRIATHGNLGITLGGISNVIDYRGAVTLTPVPRVTIVGELLGRRIADVGTIAQERVPHPSLVGVDTIRLVSTGESVNTASLVVGTKWNVTETWLANVNLAVPLTERGLRSAATLVFGVDYAFEW